MKHYCYLIEYSFDNTTHIYITDFYYQPYNLVIEVKDGGTRPNKREMPEYRAKQIEKENMNPHFLLDGVLKELDKLLTSICYCLLREDNSIETFLAEGKPVKKSTHCGLSKEEMEVPLIII